MSSYNQKLTGYSNREIARILRAEADGLDPPKRLRGQFWAGLIVGAILIAAMDYGDVWICVGACDANSARMVAGDKP